MNNQSEKIIVALDVPELSQAEQLVNELKPEIKIFKVGLELLYSAGPKRVISVLGRNQDLFVDVKLYDIPHTVAEAIRPLVQPGVRIINLHCLGGREMICQAIAAVHQRAAELAINPPLVIGVTILTSLTNDSLLKIGFHQTAAELVKRLSLLAKESGLDGVVCSPQEIEIVHQTCGSNFLVIVPGIRPRWAVKDDQKRVVTPREAIELGADYLVIGRPITRPPLEIGSSRAALQKILAEIT